MKKVSAGIILTDCIKFLVCHVTGQNFYDIPKGLIVDGEEPVKACIREVKEETGLEIKAEVLTDMGVFEYNRDKDLHLFLMVMKGLPHLKEMRCDSYFIDKKGRKLPEVNGYKYIRFDEKHLYMIKSMVAVIDRVTQEHLSQQCNSTLL